MAQSEITRKLENTEMNENTMKTIYELMDAAKAVLRRKFLPVKYKKKKKQIKSIT